MNIFLHDWAESGLEGLKNDFQITGQELEGVEILLASYSYECWSGEAFVLFRKNGRYYEVNGSHCSCYGLEGQWNPEEADLNELWNRVQNGTFGRDTWTGNEFAEELKLLLTELRGERDDGRS